MPTIQIFKSPSPPPPDKLRQALELYEQEALAALPKEEELKRAYNFTKRFNRRMEHMMKHLPKAKAKSQSRPVTHIWGRRVAVAALVATVTVTALFGVSAGHNTDLRYTISTRPEYSLVIFSQNKEDAGKPLLEEIEQYYVPTYFPEGYNRAETKLDTPQDRFIDYYNDDGQYISYEQRVLNPSTRWHIDTEDALYILPIDIDGADGFYYYNKNAYHLYWNTGTYVFTLHVPVAEDQFDEVLKVVSSLTPQP